MTEAPEYHQHEDYQVRRQKLQEIEALGIDPYPHSYERNALTESLHTKYAQTPLGGSEEAQQGATEEVAIAGRLVLFRAMGKNAFGQIQDEKGRIQIMFNRDNTAVIGLHSEEVRPLKFIEKKIDLGDIIGIKGHLFTTNKGELTVYAKEVTLLCKTLLSLPNKHVGLTDKGTRYRKRWLDLIANHEARDRLLMRSKITKLVRQYYDTHAFQELETPILQNTYGGAEARPFTTELNAYHQQMFLRIALEIPLKKLLVGGIEKIYEIGKVFRNEGIDRTHNPEFTMLESYAAYWDYNDVMRFTENLFAYIAKELFGSTKIGIRKDKRGNEYEIDLKTPWKRMTMQESLSVYAGIDTDSMDENALRQTLRDRTELDASQFASASRGKCIAMLFEELVEHHLIQPHHITDHPIETTPLCKLHREPKEREKRIVERFETFILGYEFCNAYSELNDPVLQRTLLEEQAAQRDSGDEEANPMDEEFLEAICQGMPPCGGLGIGIDRLAMLFTDAFSIRDVIYFPLMRPDEG